MEPSQPLDDAVANTTGETGVTVVVAAGKKNGWLADACKHEPSSSSECDHCGPRPT